MKTRNLVSGGCLAIAGVAAAAGLLVRELDPRERDHRSLRQQVLDISRKVGAHDGSVWFLVEGGFPPGDTHPALEPAHDQLRADLKRLDHLAGLRLDVRHVEVDADTARVDYRVEGRAFPDSEAPPPVAGQFTFRRTQRGWALSGNRFDEELRKGTVPVPSPSSDVRGHVDASRGNLPMLLYAIALLALFAAVAMRAQPWIARVLCSDEPRRSDPRQE